MSGTYERKLLDILEKQYGWLAVRSAGSMGKGDVLAIKPDHPNSPIVIEVKKISDDTFYASSGEKNKKQWWMMVGHAKRGINTCYAVRHTSGSTDNRWQVHWLDGNETEVGILKRKDGVPLDKVFS
jgi:Holliday junction resolvase